MINRGALKGFLFSFLLILAGGIVFIGGAIQSLSTDPRYASGPGVFIIIGLGLIFFGLVIGLVSCGV